jgi:hypothetical protein
MEPIKFIYNNIKIIILVVILVIISSSSLIETLVLKKICLIIYSDLSIKKKTEFWGKYNRFRILEKNYNKKINAFSNIIKII